jgi:hypothetical protein
MAADACERTSEPLGSDPVYSEGMDPPLHPAERGMSSSVMAVAARTRMEDMPGD